MARFPTLLATTAVLAGCAHALTATGPVAAPPDGSPPVPMPARTPVDDWPTYAHDLLRSGYQPQRIAITRANVARLRLRWRYALADSIQASPLVAGGSVYAEGSDGLAIALEAATGKLRWKRRLPGTIAMTPTLADGMLFIGDHLQGGRLVALDAATGAVRWRSASIPGGVRSEPAVADGIVYVGETTGDPPVCHQGGVMALDERTGVQRWKWSVDPRPHEGGAVWSPISYDGGRIFFGTGNTCENDVATANSAVALDRSGKVAWSYDTAESLADSDVGGGMTLLHGHGLIASKNGTLYDLDERTGALNWSTKVAPLPGYGPIGTPATDGKTIVVTGGYQTDPTKTQEPPGGALLGLDTGGNVRWRIRTALPISGSAAIANGVAYVSMDGAFVALALDTGAVLWRYSRRQHTYASPAVVPSGVYFADEEGRVYAFSLPARSGR